MPFRFLKHDCNLIVICTHSHSHFYEPIYALLLCTDGDFEHASHTERQEYVRSPTFVARLLLPRNMQQIVRFCVYDVETDSESEWQQKNLIGSITTALGRLLNTSQGSQDADETAVEYNLTAPDGTILQEMIIVLNRN
jgi:hypothetical protein